MSAKRKSPKPKTKAAGFKYKPRFGLIVEVGTEKEQARHYKKLKALGYEVRVVTV